MIFFSFNFAPGFETETLTDASAKVRQKDEVNEEYKSFYPLSSLANQYIINKVKSKKQKRVCYSTKEN